MQIDQVDKLSLINNRLVYDGKKINKWWGRTFFYKNTKGQLFIENFSFVTRLFHRLGYKATFKPLNLNNENINVLKLSPDTTTSSSLRGQGPKSDLLNETIDALLGHKKVKTNTDLHYAMNSNARDDEIIDLFEKGFPIDGKNPKALDDRPIYMAVTFQRPKVIQYLLLNKQCEISIESFLRAVELQDEDSIKTMIARGFDVNQKHYSRSCLEKAIEKHQNHNFYYFEKTPHYDAQRDLEQRTPSLRIIAQILKQSNQVSCQDALEGCKDKNLIEILVNKGASFKRCKNPFKNVLSVEMLEFVLAQGVDVNFLYDKQTPLDLFLSTLNLGVGKNEKNKIRQIIEVLIKKGGKIAVERSWMETSLCYLLKQQDKDLWDLFRAHELLTEKQVKQALVSYLSLSSPSKTDFMDYLLSTGATLDVIGNGITFWGSRGKFTAHSPATPLQFAIRSRDLDLMRYLIGKGANVNFKGHEDVLRPLQFAEQEGDLDAIELLKSSGAL